MGIQHFDRDLHWNYFLALEEDLVRLSRWVEFAEKNHGTYSIEIARLLMTAAAEVDVVAKMICKKLDQGSKADKIHQYQVAIVNAYPGLPDALVYLKRFNMRLTPWSEWTKPKSSPIWWSDNNKVKHQRQDHFQQANLKNALNAAAALLVLLAIYYDGVTKIVQPAPTVFDPRTFCRARADGLHIHWSRE